MLRRIIASFIASLGLAFACAGVAYAGAPGTIGDDAALSEASALVEGLRYDEDSLPSYGIDQFDFSAAYLGTSIPVYNVVDGAATFNGMQYWPIFCKDEVVAVVIACTTEEGATFVLSNDTVPEINSFLEGNKQLAIVDDGDTYYLYGPDGSVSYDRNPAFKTDALPGTAPSFPNVEFSQVQKPTQIQTSGSEAAIKSDAAAASARSSVTLDLMPVFQGFGKPTCWAASVSSIAEYITGIYRDSDSISRAIKGDLLGGSDYDVQNALSLYQYPNSSTSVSSRPLSQVVPVNQMHAWLDNGMPIYAHCTPVLSGGAHAVAVRGYYDNNGVSMLYIMNPGSGHYEVATKYSGGIYYGFPYNYTTYLWNYSSVVLTGWQKPYRGDAWRYYNSDGSISFGWRSIGNTWYYFDSNGYMLSASWCFDRGTWYYLDPGGAMATGWRNIGGTWYYFNSSGAMQAGTWLALQGDWYYLNSSGAALRGWQAIGGYWYAFDEGCRMRRGWYLDGNTWYYLRTAGNSPSGGPEGSMLSSGSWYLGGKLYSFDSSGRCSNP